MPVNSDSDHDGTEPPDAGKGREPPDAGKGIVALDSGGRQDTHLASAGQGMSVAMVQGPAVAAELGSAARRPSPPPFLFQAAEKRWARATTASSGSRPGVRAVGGSGSKSGSGTPFLLKRLRPTGLPDHDALEGCGRLSSPMCPLPCPAPLPSPGGLLHPLPVPPRRASCAGARCLTRAVALVPLLAKQDRAGEGTPT